MYVIIIQFIHLKRKIKRKEIILLDLLEYSCFFDIVDIPQDKQFSFIIKNKYYNKISIYNYQNQLVKEFHFEYYHYFHLSKLESFFLYMEEL